jgi:hypothetical protein
MSGISVQLVDAVTKQPFKEHYKDGKTYVEVEPQVEYFIKIQRKEHNVMDGEDEIPMVLAFYEVDGVNLGYRTPDTFEKPEYKGCWDFSNGVSTHTALRFGTPSVSDMSGNPINVSAGMVGTISVKIYEAVEGGLRTRQNVISRELSSQIEAPLADGKQHKAVRSENGTFSQTRSLPRVYMEYYNGKHLETITLCYGTALGLIHAGLLPRPPVWEQARLEAPATGEIDPELAGIQPTTVRDQDLTLLGITLRRGRNVELFDLTHLDTGSHIFVQEQQRI